MANYYYSGQGSLLVAERDAVTGKPLGFVPIGNVPELSLDIEVTNFEHKESESGQRLVDLILNKEKKGKFSFKLENLSLDNLALGVWGETIKVAGGSVVDEVVAIPTGGKGRKYDLAHIKVSAVTVENNAGTTTYDVDDDYVLDATNGAITIPAGSTITEGENIKVSYTYAAYNRLDAFTNTVAPERWLRFEGINTVDGSRVVVDLFRAQFDPLTGYGLLNEELGSITMKGSILADTLRSSGSKFFMQRSAG